MNKIQLYVLDHDEEYSQRLAAYIRASEFAERMQVKLFSKLELMFEVIENQQLEGVLLMSEMYFQTLMRRTTGLRRMVLSETIVNSMDAETKIPFLYRFQALHQLLTRLQAFYADNTNGEKSHGTTKTCVLSVYSSSGNSGKTMTSIHLAKQLSFRGERVFYLSLETVSSTSQWLQGETGQFSKLIYYLKSSPDVLGPKLQLLKSHDPHLRFDYLSPNDQIREMQEISGEQIRVLINTLISLNEYDYIILDLEASVHPRIVKGLELSDHIIWLIRDDLNDAYKTMALYKQMSFLQNVHFVLNKYTGMQTNDFSGLGNEISFMLPYIPEWKIIRTPQQIWESGLFSEQTYHMFTALLNGKRISISGAEGAVA
ncbi:nucleotide-binding protein [Paenibacillus planticolens]|uniref:AAA family ATPase n=1 Tax=Paenibacillus planticolens TaxID=2654976 RepID=A0ABX1ZGM6_9BACL|nr:AAA family ATPase [Paenibacillus planticolens]NOU99020.1 AAA family ATPase [Paenibacillus planticolens]